MVTVLSEVSRLNDGEGFYILMSKVKFACALFRLEAEQTLSRLFRASFKCDRHSYLRSFAPLKILEWLSFCDFTRRSTETIRMFTLGSPPGVVHVQVWTPSLSKRNDLFPL